MTQFLSAPVDRSLGTSGAWADIDVSVDVPAGATGAIFQVINTNTGGDQKFGLREKGSTDDQYAGIGPEVSVFSIVGIDSARKCQGKIDDTVVDFFLVGYTEDDAIIFTNAYDKSQTASGAWTDLDLSSELALGAVAAIFEVINPSLNFKAWGLRKKGSTDDRYGDLGGLSHVFFIVGVDASRKCQFKIESEDIDFYLIGCLTSGIAETNGVDRSLSSTGAYTDIIEAGAPAGATGSFVEFDTTEKWKYYAARKNGSSWDKYYLVQSDKCAIFVGTDGDKKWEGKIESLAHDFYTLGYFVGASTPKTSSDTGTGADAILEQLAAVLKSDAGAGAGTILEQLMTILKSDAGAGADAILESISNRGESEAGVGVDLLVDILKAIAKYDSDAGVGADALLGHLVKVIRTDQGLGLEALGSRIFDSLDEGVGVDEILEQALPGFDAGVGSDELKALLAARQGSDAGVGNETSRAEIYMYLLLKLLQEKKLILKLFQNLR